MGDYTVDIRKPGPGDRRRKREVIERPLEYVSLGDISQAALLFGLGHGDRSGDAGCPGPQPVYVQGSSKPVRKSSIGSPIVLGFRRFKLDSPELVTETKRYVLLQNTPLRTDTGPRRSVRLTTGLRCIEACRSNSQTYA